MLDPIVNATVEAWIADPAIADADKQEIRGFQSAGNEKELTDRFHQELGFGAGGMRGVIGAGLNRMNI